MWTEYLHHPCLLGGSQQWYKNGASWARGKMPLKLVVKEHWYFNEPLDAQRLT